MPRLLLDDDEGVGRTCVLRDNRCRSNASTEERQRMTRLLLRRDEGVSGASVLRRGCVRRHPTSAEERQRMVRLTLRLDEQRERCLDADAERDANLTVRTGTTVVQSRVARTCTTAATGIATLAALPATSVGAASVT